MIEKPNDKESVLADKAWNKMRSLINRRRPPYLTKEKIEEIVRMVKGEG